MHSTAVKALALQAPARIPTHHRFPGSHQHLRTTLDLAEQHHIISTSAAVQQQHTFAARPANSEQPEAAPTAQASMADNMAASTNGMGEEDQQQARATASTSPSAITTRKGKQAFENIYVQPTPTAYYRELNSLGYGLYHDTLEAFVRPLAATLAAETGSTRYVDVGCSYGNTAMGLLYGLNWAGVHSAWEASAEAVNTGVMPSEPFLSSMVLGGQVDKDSVHATGVDISAEALEYTRSTLGLYQSTFVQDFNADTIDPDLARTLESADVMSCLMCVTYMRDGVLERLVTEQFLGDRSKTKHLVYNHNCAFDDRDMHPSTLFRNLPNWTHRQKFSISRKMTEVEQETRSGAADAWNFLYHVTFEPIAA